MWNVHLSLGVPILNAKIRPFVESSILKSDAAITVAISAAVAAIFMQLMGLVMVLLRAPPFALNEQTQRRWLIGHGHATFGWLGLESSKAGLWAVETGLSQEAAPEALERTGKWLATHVYAETELEVYVRPIFRSIPFERTVVCWFAIQLCQRDFPTPSPRRRQRWAYHSRGWKGVEECASRTCASRGRVAAM